MNRRPWAAGWTIAALLAAAPAAAQPAGANYDEGKVPAYTLPDPLRFLDGHPVKTAADWPRRRQEVLTLFEEHVYGRSAAAPSGMRFVIVEWTPRALGAWPPADRYACFSRRQGRTRVRILIYVPNAARSRCPRFSASTSAATTPSTPDPGITLSKRGWSRPRRSWSTARRGRRGSRAQRPGPIGGLSTGLRPCDRLLRRSRTGSSGRLERRGPGAVQAGHHGPLRARRLGRDRRLGVGTQPRASTHLQTDPDIDARRVAVSGTRGSGKTALWAGAQDTRFSLVVSNDSGGGGAALTRRRFGETTERHHAVFPHWFCAAAAGVRRARGPRCPWTSTSCWALVGPAPAVRRERHRRPLGRPAGGVPGGEGGGARLPPARPREASASPEARRLPDRPVGGLDRVSPPHREARSPPTTGSSTSTSPIGTCRAAESRANEEGAPCSVRTPFAPVAVGLALVAPSAPGPGGSAHRLSADRSRDCERQLEAQSATPSSSCRRRSTTCSGSSASATSPRSTRSTSRPVPVPEGGGRSTASPTSGTRSGCGRYVFVPRGAGPGTKAPAPAPAARRRPRRLRHLPHAHRPRADGAGLRRRGARVPRLDRLRQGVLGGDRLRRPRGGRRRRRPRLGGRSHCRSSTRRASASSAGATAG